MDCPTCHSPMVSGEIALEETLADVVTGTFGSFSELRFRKLEQKPVTILRHSDSKPGLACETCGYFLIITDPEYTETECVACRTNMPIGVTSCPSCGWTYKQNG